MFVWARINDQVCFGRELGSKSFTKIIEKYIIFLFGEPISWILSKGGEKVRITPTSVNAKGFAGVQPLVGTSFVAMCCEFVVLSLVLKSECC